MDSDIGMVGCDDKGVASMTKFGDWPTNGPTPIGEQYLQVNPQAWLGAGENLYGMGWYTMPFYGHLTMEMYAEVDWNGQYAPALWLSVGSGSSPAPSYTADPGICQRGINIFNGAAEMRTHAYWLNLGAGAGVYAHSRIYCTAGGNVAAIRYICALMRPMPA